MTLELMFFLSLFLIAILMSFVKVHGRLYLFTSFFCLFSFSIVVRLSGYDADVWNYFEYLKIDSFSLYYLKEPFYWIGSRFLFDLTGSATFVFVFYDCIFIFLLLAACRVLALPRYFPYVFFLFFPSVLGMQNVFRQFIASGFLLLLISLVFTGAKFRYKVLTLTLATLTHNVSLLFMPLMFLKQNTFKLSSVFLLLSFFVFLLLPIAAGTKSDSNTGDLPPYLYLVIYTLIIFAYIILLEFDIKKFGFKYVQYFYALSYLWVLIFLSIFTLGGAQSKRVGMMSLLVSLIPLTLLVECRFKQRIAVRIIFVVVLVLPTLVFHNARSLLQTNEQSLQKEADARTQNHH